MRHCRYCGNSGHNRRTCPSRSNTAKESDSKYYSSRRRGRSCGYCRGSNHDKRSCVKLVADRADWVNRNAEFRKRFLEDAKNEGWGVGAIFKQEHWNHVERFHIITKINWDAIVVDANFNYALTTMEIGKNSEDICTYNSPRYFGHTGSDREYYKKYEAVSIVNPISVDSIINSVPANWLTGMTTKAYMPSDLR